MRKIRIALKVTYVIPFILLSACSEKENVAPTVNLVTPVEGETILQGGVIPVKAMADDEDGSITELLIYVEGDEVANAEASTLVYNWNTADLEVGEYVLSALARDDEDKSDAVNIRVMLDTPGGFNPDLSYGTLSDIDGNSYGTIEIGTQVWMAENLKVTKYPDGSPITQISGETEWNAMTPDVQAYCWYDNLTEYSDTSGALYTWAAAMNGALSSDTIPSGVQGVCPDGWHIPSDAEWKVLEMFLGMSQADADTYDWRGSDEGGQLKETGFSNWAVPNTGGSNLSGFTAVPGGFRSAQGNFYSIDQYATFWTSGEEAGTDKAWYRTLHYDKEQVYRQYNDMRLGLSVRGSEDEYPLRNLAPIDATGIPFLDVFGKDEVLVELQVGVFCNDQFSSIACKMKDLGVSAQVGYLQIEGHATLLGSLNIAGPAQFQILLSNFKSIIGTDHCFDSFSSLIR